MDINIKCTVTLDPPIFVDPQNSRGREWFQSVEDAIEADTVRIQAAEARVAALEQAAQPAPQQPRSVEPWAGPCVANKDQVCTDTGEMCIGETRCLEYRWRQPRSGGGCCDR